MKPVCVDCRQFFHPEKNGIYFEEGMPADDSSAWKPYKLWIGDLWRCHGCGKSIVVGVPPFPISEHYLADYAEQCRRYDPQFRVDDC